MKKPRQFALKYRTNDLLSSSAQNDPGGVHQRGVFGC